MTGYAARRIQPTQRLSDLYDLRCPRFRPFFRFGSMVSIIPAPRFPLSPFPARCARFRSVIFLAFGQQLVIMADIGHFGQAQAPTILLRGAGGPINLGEPDDDPLRLSPLQVGPRSS